MNDVNHLQNQMPPQGPAMKDVLRSATQAAAESDLDRHRATGTRMLARAQEALALAEHSHAIARAKIVADAEMQLTELRAEYHERLREADAKHEREVARLDRDIARLMNVQAILEAP